MPRIKPRHRTRRRPIKLICPQKKWHSLSRIAAHVQHEHIQFPRRCHFTRQHGQTRGITQFVRRHENGRLFPRSGREFGVQREQRAKVPADPLERLFIAFGASVPGDDVLRVVRLEEQEETDCHDEDEQDAFGGRYFCTGEVVDTLQGLPSGDLFVFDGVGGVHHGRARGRQSSGILWQARARGVWPRIGCALGGWVLIYAGVVDWGRQ